MARLWIPREMRVPPRLDPGRPAGPVRELYALLINPFYPKDPRASFGKHVLTPSLALTSLAAATPPDWQVRYWDETLLQGPPPSQPLPQVVGITVHLTFARRAYELSAWYRRRGCKVVLGGPHVVSCPDEAAANADAIAIGEGVQLWPRILGDVQRDSGEPGVLKRVYVGEYTRAFRDDPPPRRDILPAGSFLTDASVIATRGCHNRCDFCYLATAGLRMPFQMRDVDEVAAELAASDEPYAVFIDNNLGSRPAYLRALCRAIRPLEKIWSAAVSLDVTDDPELVREMALAGCTGVFIGFETLSQANLAAAHKRSPRPTDYARRVCILHDCGIQVNGSFVLGLDDDHPDVFERTALWIESNRLECATFHILTPYPGTPLFARLDAEGRLLHRNWSLYDTAHAVFRPRHMTAEQLEEGYSWCYRRLFSHASIWHRRPADWRAVPAYLAMSYLYKKANPLWSLLIRRRWTHAVWSPLIEWSRRRHLRFRARLADRPRRELRGLAAAVVAAGV